MVGVPRRVRTDPQYDHTRKKRNFRSARGSNLNITTRVKWLFQYLTSLFDTRAVCCVSTTDPRDRAHSLPVKKREGLRS